MKQRDFYRSQPAAWPADRMAVYHLLWLIGLFYPISAFAQGQQTAVAASRDVHQIRGHIVDQEHRALPGVQVYLEGFCNDHWDSTETNDAGEYLLCGPETNDHFIVTPYKKNDSLIGISTFDLVLLNRYILGQGLFNSPYTIIAADVNRSNTITPFDIVSLRKLILGIVGSFNEINANQASWRFIPADFDFPNPSNPFQMPHFPETDSVPPSSIDFIGVKVGDVNNNAVGQKPTDVPETTVGWPDLKAKNGKTLTVPVLYTGMESLEAIQVGMRFDPAVLEWIGPSKGDLPGTTAGSFGLTRVKEGEVRMLWFPDGSEPDQHIAPGQTLFYLSFRLLQALPDAGLPIRLDDAVLENLAWRSDDLEYCLRVAPPAKERETAPASESLRADCLPNPTSGNAVFTITAPVAAKGRIALFDPFGKLIFMRNVALQAGEQQFPAPEVAQLPAGVYVWKVFAGGAKASGHLVKQ